MSRPFFLRPSDTLQQAVDRSGPRGSALKALLIIGLLEAGTDKQQLEADYYEALGGRGLASGVRVALERAWQGAEGERPTLHLLAASLQSASTTEEEEEEADPLMSIGIAV